MARDPIPELFDGRTAGDLVAGRTLVACHGALDRLPELLRTGLLADAGHLCRHYTGPVQIANGSAAAGAQHRVGRGWAARLLDMGVTVVFDALGAEVPASGPWLRSLEEALAAPPGCARLMGFVNAPGSGLPLHHDRYDQLLIHLEGTKTYRWRPSDLDHADLRFSHPDPAPAAFGASYAEGFPPAPEDVLADMEEIELRPGTALFVPGGTWHLTAGQRERAMSAVVVLEVPSRAEVFLDLLAGKLASSPSWRARTYGGWGDDERRAEARTDLHPLVSSLAEQLRDLDLDGAFAAWQLSRSIASASAPYPSDARFARYIRLPWASVTVRETVDGGGLLVRVRCGQGTYAHADTTLCTMLESRRVLDWIEGCSRAFHVEELRAVFPAIDEEELHTLLSALGQAGLIRPLP